METNQVQLPQTSQTYSPNSSPPPQTAISPTSFSEPKKRKVSRANIFVLVILLIILGIIALYFLSNESKIANCEIADDCGIYNVFYINGNGYLCANNDMAKSNSFKLRVLMFKYANKKALDSEPLNCLCSSNKCEADLD